MQKLRFFIMLISVFAAAFNAHAQPSFKGGEQALDAYLKQHIIYPEFSSKNCIEATVKVSFRVDKNGKVSNVKTRDAVGLDLDDEAIRVVKMTTGKWTIPAGREAVNYLLPIRFTPDQSHCQAATKMTIAQAIATYRARQELENAVTNYYENKYAGKADTTKQSAIDALKKQLGFDDELIDELLEKAAAKLKQGDNEGACADWKFIRNIGSTRADDLLARYCK
ncbi:TonB family protein [Mucilaginibacter mali]|uniref:TonB family protein n=1 Tax=Mucilaginibacter mali TaxID=2740462 RepID=A0A7D4UCX1_9SPHI|nr:TonB family protein [Mucilaginibacter mali]QKJ32058.1 TonB family protein [Mucilaginibacter mali]